MKLEKKISLHAFEVEYIDQREAKPRTLHRESIVLDGGRMNTLDHLNQTPQSWIRQQYAQQGSVEAGRTGCSRSKGRQERGQAAGRGCSGMTAAQWQEVLCRVRSLSAADKDRLLTYLHALHDAAQQPQRVEAMPNTPKVL